MRRFEGFSTTARLWAAAGLCLLPLGLVWSRTSSSFTIGYTIYGTCNYAEPGTYCTDDMYVPGTFSPGSSIHGFSATARVFLVLAAAAFVWVATRRRTPGTRRWARIGVVSALIALVLAVAGRSITSVACLVAAVALVAPPAWRGARRPAVFGAERSGR
jgi:hypothetical protein